VREQPAELVNGVDGIEADRAGVGADPRAGVHPARPLGQVISLERFEQFGLHPRVCGDLVEGNAIALAVPA
jgi:hypothetical protein